MMKNLHATLALAYMRGTRTKMYVTSFCLTQGQTVTPYQLSGNKPYPLIYAADAVVPGTPANVTK